MIETIETEINQDGLQVLNTRLAGTIGDLTIVRMVRYQDHYSMYYEFKYSNGFHGNINIDDLSYPYLDGKGYVETRRAEGKTWPEIHEEYILDCIIKLGERAQDVDNPDWSDDFVFWIDRMESDA